MKGATNKYPEIPFKTIPKPSISAKNYAWLGSDLLDYN